MTWRDVEARVAEQIAAQTFPRGTGAPPLPRTIHLDLTPRQANRIRRALLNETRRADGLPPVHGGV